MLIAGSCHCGNISFKLDWTPEPTEIPARACTCSFCTRHGAVWTACPTGAVAVTVRQPAGVSHYGFGTRTAAFHVCAACGAVPVVTSRIGGRLYAAVNVNAFEGVDPALLKRAAVSFDAEDEQTRLARRARHWIPSVVFSEGDALTPARGSPD